MSALAHFFIFLFELAGSSVAARCCVLTIMDVLRASNFNKARNTAITISRRLSQTTRTLSRIVCRGHERPTGSKDTLKPDFEANTIDLGFF
jgi:hypothetical protein